MLTDKLSVGTRKGAEFAVEVNVRVPATQADCLACAKGKETYVVAKFNRAWRIDNQEDSGARAHVEARIAGKSKVQLEDQAFVKALTGEVQKIVDEYDPTAERRRGRPAGPVVVALTPAEMKLSGAALMAVLAAKGIKVETE